MLAATLPARLAAALPLALLLLALRRMVAQADHLEIDRGLGNPQVHLLERIDENARYREIAEPLLVRRDDVPGGVLRRGRAYRVLERLDIGRPVFARGIVRHADLPIPMQIGRASCRERV